MDDDPLLVVLVEADVGEELARACLAEGPVGEELGGLRARAALDLVLVHCHGAGGDPRRPGDHPLPAVLDRDDPVVLDRQVRLVMEAAQALNDRLLDFVEALRGLAALGVDPEDCVVVHLHLEVPGPAAIAAKPRRAVSVELAHLFLLKRPGAPGASLEALRDLRTPSGSSCSAACS